MQTKIIIVLMVLVILGFAGVSGQLAYVQLVKGQEYQKKAIEQQLRDITISPKRGTIYDTNMKPLAQSASVWTVILAPASIKEEQRDLIADGLSRILEMDRDTVYKKTKKTNMYEIVKRKIEEDVKDQVSAFIAENKISCITLQEDNKRYYPYGNFAASVLGFTGVDNEGLEGLEAYYDSYLTGKSGRMVAAKNARGTDMPFTYEKVYEAQDGNSLVLTIDEVLQHYLEKNLESAVVQNQVANRAAGIIMDVDTGEVLAMSTKGDYDPNNPREIFDSVKRAAIEAMSGEEQSKAKAAEQTAQWRNKAISDTYEPGSVFKAFTASAGIEEHLVNVGETYHCTGSLKVASETIRCWKAGGHGSQTFGDALKNSCNPAFMAIGQKLGAENFFKYFKAFGFTEKTGIDLPGEAESIYHPLSKIGIVELSSSSFGQTFKVTPIQMITAMSAIANGGNLMQPHVVRQILDGDGNIVKSIEPTVKRQVISESTSQQMCSALERVVAEGTGKNCYLMGYQIAGKTGTSQKIDQKNEQGQIDKYIASFCAFAPAEDPKIVCLVMVDEPMGASHGGGAVAAPIIRDIMADALPYLAIEPRYTEAELAKLDVAAPNLLNRNVADAKTALEAAGLKASVVGSGETVVRQIPEQGRPVPKGGSVVLYTDGSTKTVKVPNFIGMTLSQVNSTAMSYGINVMLSGTGLEGSKATAYKQSIEEGQEVEQGTVVTVEFLTTDVE